MAAFSLAGAGRRGFGGPGHALSQQAKGAAAGLTQALRRPGAATRVQRARGGVARAETRRAGGAATES